ncbi:glutamate mutase L [Nocardioides solisilvae]|uniref:glutamate mutase L n=1 Tax=Nocardioides solisilvae TaxID=1542435 RepID=UPI001EF5C592|nr:glutamate mutase L [Nocardioides solisilvae]
MLWADPSPVVEEGAPRPSRDLAVCADFGSTFTKTALVDLADGRLVATASHRTTLPDGAGADLLDGLDACRAVLAEADPAAADAPVLACSSAGGGLRIAVVGNEELVTAEAGRRVALSSGGRVVAVLAGGLDDERYAALVAAEPDVLLLVGGTDGGNAARLEADAAALAVRGWALPVVVAGDVTARDRVVATLAGAGVPVVPADNVVPRIGVLAPESARHAIREVFLSHVIGGKHLSTRAELGAIVRGATPDVVLDGVEQLAGLVGDVVVVDVGGATTDVHSAVEPDPDTTRSGAGGLSREVVASTPLTRTVEGDLGMRWSAPSTVAAALEANLPLPRDVEGAATRRQQGPGLLPTEPADTELDEALARTAVVLALRRHAGRARVVLGPDGRVVERSGKDLREVRLLVGSGGVLRHGRPGVADRVLGAALADPGDWQLPRGARVVVDDRHVLAWAGLLAGEHPTAAHRLLERWLATARG